MLSAKWNPHLPIFGELGGRYREQEAAVLLQRTQEAQEGDAGDDDAADQQQVGDAQHAQIGRAGDEAIHFKGRHQVPPQTHERHAAHLTQDKLVSHVLCASPNNTR